MKYMQTTNEWVAKRRASRCRYLSLLLIAVISAAGVAEEDVEASVQLRDPTRPLSYVEGVGGTKSSAWRLDSVLISSQRKLAVINGKSVSEDSWVRGAQVKQIQANKVVIVVKGEERVLRLRSGIRKTKVEG